MTREDRKLVKSMDIPSKCKTCKKLEPIHLCNGHIDFVMCGYRDKRLGDCEDKK